MLNAEFEEQKQIGAELEVVIKEQKELEDKINVDRRPHRRRSRSFATNSEDRVRFLKQCVNASRWFREFIFRASSRKANS